MVACSEEAPDCWLNLDQIRNYRDSGDFERATAGLENISSCLESQGEPKQMRFHYHQGWLFHEEGKFEQAIEAYNKGLVYQPDYVFAYWRRGLAYESLGRQEDASINYREAMRVGEETLPEFLEILNEYPEIEEKLLPYASTK